jgi:PAS domain S-box-containing protein
MKWAAHARPIRVLLALILALILASSAAADTSTIKLSAKERQWLAGHPRITVVQDPLWPPVEFAGPGGESQGITADYLALIESRLGISFERVRGLSWQEAYGRLRAWDIDMTTSVAVTPEREAFWSFTKPYMRIPIVIVARSDVTYIASLVELVGKEAVVVEGYALGDWLPRDFPRLKLVKVSSAIEGLKLVESGKAFAFIDNMLVASYYMAKLKLTGLKIAGSTPYENAQSMAVRKDWQPLVGILDKALASVSEEERDAIYYRWVPIRYEHGFDYELLWRILPIACAILAALALWILRLRREVERRKKTEEKLARSEGRLRLHLRETPVAVIEWDRDFRVVSWNPAAERIFGYTESEAIGKEGYFIISGEERAQVESIWKELLAGQRNLANKNRNITKDGRTIYCAWINTSLAPEGGPEAGVFSIALDITKQTRDEENLRAALREREVLVRELYHRTKNSLNVISSMLQLQAMSVLDEALSSIVRKTVFRIQAMALIHQKLYESRNLSRIDLGDYLRAIIEALMSQYKRPGLELRSRYELESVEVLIDIAQPCGLLVNELAMNSFQHAFAGRQEGTISVRLRRVGAEGIELQFEDDGIGVKSGRDLRKADSLGLLTVFEVAEAQLGAAIDYESSGGLRWRIRFEGCQYAERVNCREEANS